MAQPFNLVAMTVSSAFGASTTIPLAAAATINSVTYLSFLLAGAADGTSVDYSILDTGASEIGVATYSSNTLTNRTPTKSTNGGAAIVASSAAIVLGTLRAESGAVLTSCNTFSVGNNFTSSNTFSGANTFSGNNNFTSSNTFTADISVNSLFPTSQSTTEWNLDFQNSRVSVGPSSFVNLVDGSGAIMLTDGTVTGATGLYLTGGSAAVLVAQTTTTAPYVAPSSSPGSSRYSITLSSGSHYAIFNGSTSTTISFYVATFRVRPTT